MPRRASGTTSSARSTRSRNANGVSNKVTYLVHTHHHADHAGASSLFGKDVVRIGHEETRRLLLRDDDPARPAPEETFSDRRTLEIGGERIELAWHGANHTPDNSVIHFPEHDTLMMVDIVNAGWVPVYVVNLSDDIPGYLAMPAAALTYPWKTLISGHLGRLGRATTSRSTSSTWPTSRPAPGPPSTPSIRRPTSRSTAAEPLGRRQGLPRRGRRRDGRPGHREVHGRARGRGRVHPGRRVLAHGVDPAQPRVWVAGAPVGWADADEHDGGCSRRSGRAGVPPSGPIPSSLASSTRGRSSGSS